jgi:hypothetical protein
MKPLVIPPGVDPKTRALFNALLEHLRGCLKTLKITSPYTIALSYEELADASGYPGHRRALGKNLGVIAEICHTNGLPPLNALVIRRSSKGCQPGEGYNLATGCDLKEWQATAASVIACKDYPESLP